MQNVCKRCQDSTFDGPVQLFSIYHTLLCQSCRNDFELWMRKQEFWDRYLDMEASQRLLDMSKVLQTHYHFEEVREIGSKWDALKLSAFPLIEAWMKAGKVKES